MDIQALMQESVRTANSEYHDIAAIIRETAREGDTVVEMFAWLKPMVCSIAKGILGPSSRYYAISKDDPKDNVLLYISFMKMYDDYLESKTGVERCIFDHDMSGIILAYLEGAPHFDFLANTLTRARELTRGMNPDELFNDPRGMRNAQLFLDQLNLIYRYHTMPPLLPGNEQAGQVQLIIETYGFQYCPKGLWAPVALSAFDSLRAGGNLVIRQNSDLISHITGNLELLLPGRDDYSVRAIEGLDRPENNLIIQKM